MTVRSATGSTSWIDDVAIRVLADGLIVYVSFEAQTDSDGPTSDDYVDVALTDANRVGDSIVPVHSADWFQYCEPGLTGCTNSITVVPND